MTRAEKFGSRRSSAGDTEENHEQIRTAILRPIFLPGATGKSKTLTSTKLAWSFNLIVIPTHQI
jgi:hypothetical protein